MTQKPETKKTRKLNPKTKKALLFVVLALIFTAGLVLVLYSVGTSEGDHIKISSQVTLNVKKFIAGLIVCVGANKLYDILFK